MTTQIIKMPDISDYLHFIAQYNIVNEISIIVDYKTLFRSDDVLVDVYLNEISDNTKIVSGRKITKDSLVSMPRPELGFNYNISCVDQDTLEIPINKYNIHKFYLQFSDSVEEII